MLKNNSYMNVDNILTEIDLSTIFKYLFSSKFRRLVKHTKNPQIKRALADLNLANDKLASAFEDAFGKKMKNVKHLTAKDLVK